MRWLFNPQLTFNPHILDFEKAQEMKEISELLDRLPGIKEVYQAVHQDLVGQAKSDRGCMGMSAEQVVKVGILRMRHKQMDYRTLEYLIADSNAMRTFLGIRGQTWFKKSTLQRNLKKVSEASWKKLNDCMKAYAREQKIEEGTTVRSDTTATQTNIHHPTDAGLLWDSVRVIVRILSRLQEKTNAPVKFSNHTRRVKKKDIRSTI